MPADTTDPAKERHVSDPATTLDPATTSRQPFDEVPEAARGPAIDPARGYLVEELRGAWWLTDGDYQALLVASAEGTVLVDAPPSLAPHLPAAVAEVAGAPVTQSSTATPTTTTSARPTCSATPP